MYKLCINLNLKIISIILCAEEVQSPGAPSGAHVLNRLNTILFFQKRKNGFQLNSKYNFLFQLT